MVTQDRENDGLAGMACWKELIARPVKDMAKNFNIDVDHILKNYLGKRLLNGVELRPQFCVKGAPNIRNLAREGAPF